MARGNAMDSTDAWIAHGREMSRRTCLTPQRSGPNSMRLRRRSAARALGLSTMRNNVVI